RPGHAAAAGAPPARPPADAPSPGEVPCGCTVPPGHRGPPRPLEVRPRLCRVLRYRYAVPRRDTNFPNFGKSRIWEKRTRATAWAGSSRAPPSSVLPADPVEGAGEMTSTTGNARTLAEKVWDRHLVRRGEGAEPDLLYIDLHLVHEVTSPQAFD